MTKKERYYSLMSVQKAERMAETERAEALRLVS